jgi:hypothetical protein
MTETDTGNQQSQAGDGHAGHVTMEELAERQQATDAKVDGIGAKLDQLLGNGHAAAQDHVERKLDDPGHLDEIKKAIRDVNAEQAAAQAQAAQAAGQGKPSEKPPEPETAPREAMQAWKAKLQHRMFDGGKRP